MECVRSLQRSQNLIKSFEHQFIGSKIMSVCSTLTACSFPSTCSLVVMKYPIPLLPTSYPSSYVVVLSYTNISSVWNTMIDPIACSQMLNEHKRNCADMMVRNWPERMYSLPEETVHEHYSVYYLLRNIFSSWFEPSRRTWPSTREAVNQRQSQCDFIFLLCLQVNQNAWI